VRWDQSRLIEALHRGIFDRPLWSGFLDQMRDMAGVAHVGLRVRAGDEDAPLQLHSARGQDTAAPLNPYLYDRMRPGRVYALEELIDGHDGPLPRSSALRHMRIARVGDAGGMDAWLHCADAEELKPSVGALLSAMLPHLAVAVRTYGALEQERQRASFAAETFGRLNAGWITVDASCRIIDMTPYADEFFRRSALLRRGRYDRLVPASPAVDRELTDLVKAFARGEDRPPRAFNLSRDPLADILVAPLRNGAAGPQKAAVAILYLSGDHWSRQDRHEQIAALFGLLPSEARMAWAMTQGLSIAEAAASIGLSVETGRHYSKNIYAKTGARGHADLVRIILTSALAIV
jgi:DNA-binding CsgD family transcriptional regulator